MSHAELQHTTRSPKWQPSTANCSPPSPSKHTHANTHILCKPQGPQYEAFIRAAAKYSEHAGFYETQESDIGAELGLQAPGAAVITNFKGAWVCHNAHKRYGPSQWVYITYYHRAGIVSDPPPLPNTAFTHASLTKCRRQPARALGQGRPDRYNPDCEYRTAHRTGKEWSFSVVCACVFVEGRPDRYNSDCE